MKKREPGPKIVDIGKPVQEDRKQKQQSRMPTVEEKLGIRGISETHRNEKINQLGTWLINYTEQIIEM